MERNIAQFTLIERLGKGGMGEVWRATDARLGREVAVKMLRQNYHDNPERRDRLTREARLLASLQHPNIGSIYELVRTKDHTYLVMELVEGEDLAERLSKGPLGAKQTLNLLEQILAGLEYAHDRGVIHRDLKPANLMLSPGGRLRILDFGLAKSLPSPGVEGANPVESLTATVPGTIVGSAAYMSPEQARGQPVDARTDIWSLGCVLHECLSGRRAFDGETATDVLARVLSGEPVSSLPHATPPSLARLIRRCLKTEPTERFHHAADVRIFLEEMEAVSESPPTSPWHRRRWWPWAAATVGAFVVGRFGFGGATPLPEPPPSRQLVVAFPPGQAPAAAAEFDVSPDGNVLAYSLGGPGGARMMLHHLELGTTTEVPGDGAALRPSFAGDDLLLYELKDKLVKYSPGGTGLPMELCEASYLLGATLGEDQRVYFTPSASKGISWVPLDGGTPTTLTQPDTSAGQFGHWWPDYVPGNRFLLFTAWFGVPEEAELHLYDLRTGKQRRLASNAVGGHYHPPTRSVLFERDGSLMSQSFDANRGTLTGGPQPVLPHVAVKIGNGFLFARPTRDGAVVYVDHRDLGDRESLWWWRPDGTVEELEGELADYQSIQLDPGGERLAFIRQAANRAEVWVKDLARGVATPVTSDGAASLPHWGPGDNAITYQSVRGGPQNLRTAPIDRSAPARTLVRLKRDVGGGSWSRDGRYVAYHRWSADRGADLWVMDTHGDTTRVALLATPANEYFPEISPNGKLLAYGANDTGSTELYVQGFPTARGRVQITNHGTLQHVWSPDSKSIYYLSNDGEFTVYRAAISSSPRLTVGVSEKVVSSRDLRGRINEFAVHPDGRVLLVVDVDSRSPHYRMATGWLRAGDS